MLRNGRCPDEQVERFRRAAGPGHCPPCRHRRHAGLADHPDCARHRPRRRGDRRAAGPDTDRAASCPPCYLIPRGHIGRSGPFLARQPEASEDHDRRLKHILTRARDASDQSPPSSSIAAGPWPVDAACRARGYRLASVIVAFIAAALGATTPDAAPEVLTQAAQARAGLISIQVWAALSPLRRPPYPRRPGLADTRG